MELKIAGGCGEHGRNCFLVDAGETAFLVDCGIMAGSENPFPLLTAEEIRRVKYVFLTHSHADHTGALPWLYKSGFCGKIIAAACTLEQLPFSLKNAISLEQICPKNIGKVGDIEIEYGRAGHCVGSVWYHFRVGESSALFSGDYTENSTVYYCDKIRGKNADFAVLDCAYGNDNRNFKQCCDEIISAVRELKKRYNTLFFPVPKFGRGIDLLKLLQESFPKYIFCGDEHFLEQICAVQDNRFWFKSTDFSALEYQPNRCDILFLSDVQLRSEQSREIVRRLTAQGGFGVMTGTVESGSFSETLIQSGRMQLLRYPVHQNYKEFKLLSENNDFKRVIPYHSAEFREK